MIATATENGVLRGILHFVPWGPDGLSLDLMRRDRSAQPGVNDFLIVETIKAAERTRHQAHLAELRRVPRPRWSAASGSAPGRCCAAWRGILLFASRWFQIESLYKFNAKFAPVWVPRFFVFAGHPGRAAGGARRAGGRGVPGLAEAGGAPAGPPDGAGQGPAPADGPGRGAGRLGRGVGWLGRGVGWLGRGVGWLGRGAAGSAGCRLARPGCRPAGRAAGGAQAASAPTASKLRASKLRASRPRGSRLGEHLHGQHLHGQDPDGPGSEGWGSDAIPGGSLSEVSAAEPSSADSPVEVSPGEICAPEICPAEASPRRSAPEAAHLRLTPIRDRPPSQAARGPPPPTASRGRPPAIVFTWTVRSVSDCRSGPAVNGGAYKLGSWS